ncbi:DUF1830 domain-containing protein [Pseudanabaena sp. FACHB-2040]|uniref:DUF1830 domain-containing protein n=1 Tax=Pseudanabaena sp. FACHB-2040 TaxID=2692859 RepID=UPI00168797C3|nr:DUF1830 domain-containing protein [Pseudanabaena sp. FACHB-2040]MBD0269851.1 DUF1830 domain-containing protein [Cyanobacteria bacterium Co-bin8]MBD2257386.1 DUF1830 domain-containing protein [Pseudanabaena sp. FACHB-2040]
MAQILDPLPSDSSKNILCCYINATSKIQIARITNIPDWYFERVVFPGQRLIFETTPLAMLEIHTGMIASSILSDTILCERLMIDNDPLGESPLDQELAEAMSLHHRTAEDSAVAPVAVVATAD